MRDARRDHRSDQDGRVAPRAGREGETARRLGERNASERPFPIAGDKLRGWVYDSGQSVGARFRDVKVLLADARISTGADEMKEDPL